MQSLFEKYVKYGKHKDKPKNFTENKYHIYHNLQNSDEIAKSVSLKLPFDTSYVSLKN